MLDNIENLNTFASFGYMCFHLRVMYHILKIVILVEIFESISDTYKGTGKCLNKSNDA